MDWTGPDWTGLDWCQETHARLGSADLVAVAMPPILYLDLHKLFGFEVRAHGGVVRAHSVLSYNWTLGLFELTEYHQIVCDVHTHCMHVSMTIAM